MNLKTGDGKSDSSLIQEIVELKRRLAAAERVVDEVRLWAGDECSDLVLCATIRAYDENK